MDIVVVDRVVPEYAEQIVSLLRETGLHPQYDDLPRLIVHNNTPSIQTKTAIYVPAEEAEAAKTVLAAFYEENSLQQRERLSQLPPIYKGLIKPTLMALAIGIVVAIVSRNPFYGFAAWLVSFLVAAQTVGHRRN